MKSKRTKQASEVQLAFGFSTEKIDDSRSLKAERPKVVLLSRRRESAANQRIIERLKISKVFA